MSKRSSQLHLRGTLTALVTPFTEAGSLDHSALEGIVRWQVEQGIHGLVPCGTTGEAPTPMNGRLDQALLAINA